MSNIAIVFWSATGNTEAMADAVKAGAQEAGAEVSVFTASDFSADMVANFDAIAFGCPAMGDEVLEEDEFQPMFDAVLPSLNGKKVALFGSYGWGDGQWMRTLPMMKPFQLARISARRWFNFAKPTRTPYEKSNSAINRRFCYYYMR